jgi:hypothetical protein
MQQGTDLIMYNAIEFNGYILKFSKLKTWAPNQNLQIIWIIQHINAIFQIRLSLVETMWKSSQIWGFSGLSLSLSLSLSL